MGLKHLIKAFKYALLFAVALSILAVSYLRLLDDFELGSLDLRFIFRPKIPVSDEAVIIEIGEDSIRKLGRFPFDRSYHAILIKALSEFGAKDISFDIFFSEPQENDQELADAMRKAGNVYLPFVFDLEAKKHSKIITASAYLARCLDNLSVIAKGTGHINIIPDTDGKFRRVPVYIRSGNALYPYLPILVACDYLGISEKDVKIKPGQFVLMGQYMKIPLDENSNMIINYSGKWGASYKHYSYVDVLQSYFSHLSGKKPSIDPNEFKGKICMVGVTAAGTGDVHPSPFESLYPGVGIHAEIFNSILNKKFVARASREVNLVILTILALLMFLATLKTKPTKGFLVLVAASFVFLLISVLLFNLFGLWIDAVCPVAVILVLYLSVTLYKYVTEWKRRLVLENELEIARKIQESFLPKKIPDIKGVDMSAAMFTARQVGGDLYDILVFPDEKFGVMIGDVSGKGVPASLFMAMTVGTFKSFALSSARPEEVLSSLNSKLISESSSNLFVTVSYAVFDFKDRVVSYANGGHLPVLHLPAGPEEQFLDVKDGAPLGLMEGAYSAAKTGFNKDDVFIFYTDGITEAMNQRRDMYEKERLTAIAKANRHMTSKQILAAIEKDVRKFEPKSSQHDDITLIVVKIT